MNELRTASGPMEACARRALELVEPGQTLGLGSGRAAERFIHMLGSHTERRDGIRAVATSTKTAQLARELGIPLIALDAVGELDLTVDGADEVDANLDLIKGYGGALVRERIVAASSRRLVILVGSEKLVTKLGERGRLPVEVLPFGLALCRRRLDALGLAPQLRMGPDGQPFTTDNANRILDCSVGAIPEPDVLDRELRALPGVVGTGLFLGMADLVIIEREGQTELRSRSPAGAR